LFIETFLNSSSTGDRVLAINSKKHTDLKLFNSIDRLHMIRCLDSHEEK